MNNKFLVFGQDKVNMGLGGRRSITGEKHNRCVIVPSSADIIAQAIERKHTNWSVLIIVSLYFSCFFKLTNSIKNLS